jgi:hypothetical protein
VKSASSQRERATRRSAAGGQEVSPSVRRHLTTHSAALAPAHTSDCGPSDLRASVRVDIAIYNVTVNESDGCNGGECA